jgi:hypothetical protein
MKPKNTYKTKRQPNSVEDKRKDAKDRSARLASNNKQSEDFLNFNRQKPNFKPSADRLRR